MYENTVKCKIYLGGGVCVRPALLLGVEDFEEVSPTAGISVARRAGGIAVLVRNDVAVEVSKQIVVALAAPTFISVL